jgi:hypothetical protein
VKLDASLFATIASADVHLAKVDVAGSSPVSRSRKFKPDAQLRLGLLSF